MVFSSEEQRVLEQSPLHLMLAAQLLSLMPTRCVWQQALMPQSNALARDTELGCNARKRDARLLEHRFEPRGRSVPIAILEQRSPPATGDSCIVCLDFRDHGHP